MISVEPIMIDETPLNLKTPFPEGIGNYYIIHVIESEEKMPDEERIQEIDLAEVSTTRAARIFRPVCP